MNIRSDSFGASGRDAHSSQKLVIRAASARVPTTWGEFMCHSFESLEDGEVHLAFVMGEVDTAEPVLARVHSECVTGDVFNSVKCDCGLQLNEAMSRVAQAGRGVVIYLRGHEGRGIGISQKLKAYELQDQGFDTVDANLELGMAVDARDYGVGAQILIDLGVGQLRLMTNNPAKYQGLAGKGLIITELVPLHVPIHPEAERYIETKRGRLGHHTPDSASIPAPPSDVALG